MASPSKQAEARKIVAQRKVKKAVDAVKEAREQATDLEVTAAGEWKSAEVEEGVKLLLPSGNVCLARNPGLLHFIEQGKIPNALLPIVNKAIAQGKGMSAKDTQAAADDPNALADILAFTNEVIVASVVQPKVALPPRYTAKDFEDDECTEEEVGEVAEEKRIDGVLYADKVDLTDKMFIFQWVVGGTRDIERFREESSAALAGLRAGEVVGEAAE